MIRKRFRWADGDAAVPKILFRSSSSLRLVFTMGTRVLLFTAVGVVLLREEPHRGCRDGVMVYRSRQKGKGQERPTLCARDAHLGGLLSEKALINQTNAQ